MSDEKQQVANWLGGYSLTVFASRPVESSRALRRIWSSRSRGFTLIEMMLVVTIILVVSGIVGITLARTFRAEMLRSEARVLMATVQQARYQAVVRQYPMMLKFDFGNQAYWVEMSSETVTNLTAQIFSMSTNSLNSSFGNTNVSTVIDTADLSTNAVIVALPTMTRRDLGPPLRLAQVQTLDGDVLMSDIATITVYPNGSCQGGMIVLAREQADAIGVELDPLTSLPRLVLDPQLK